jgi:hypothetical protein
MSSTLEDAVAELIFSDAVTFASLPLPLAHRIFLALPVDVRGRASCVCRAWRDVLAEPSLWTRLDLSFVPSDDWQRCASVLRGAARRARGSLRQLDLSQHDVARQLLLLVLTANAGSLRELHLHTVCANNDYFDPMFPTVEAVVAAAPLLQVLLADRVVCTWEDAPRMLRAEPPFSPLQMRGILEVLFDAADARVGGMERVIPFATVLADATLQPALLRLCARLADVAQPAAMGALADAAIARRLRELTLRSCTAPAAAPLARLLAEGSLAELDIGPLAGVEFGTPLFDVAGAALVAHALRVNATLTKLKLRGAHMFARIPAAQSLLGALVGHRSLRELCITTENSMLLGLSVFGAALAALIASDTPALQVLVCLGNRLGDAGLAPIVDALPLNHHLRKLDVAYNRMSEAFARERLLPALRTNTTLREFACVSGLSRTVAEAEAEELVRRRGQHD